MFFLDLKNYILLIVKRHSNNSIYKVLILLSDVIKTISIQYFLIINEIDSIVKNRKHIQTLVKLCN